MIDEEALRKLFETSNRDSYNFRRSRKGTYINPVIARDWKWFRNGALIAEEMQRKAQERINHG